ncbi:unnamed protein product [Choristocarpus tenellus]
MPEDFVDILRRPGVPSIDNVSDLKILVGAAPRVWTSNFRKAGGRECVSRKLKEVESLECTMTGWRRLFKWNPGQMYTETREELMKVLLYIHLW